jgi:hypothetical protein
MGEDVEVIAAYFKVFSQQMPRTEENHENLQS